MKKLKPEIFSVEDGLQQLPDLLAAVCEDKDNVELKSHITRFKKVTRRNGESFKDFVPRIELAKSDVQDIDAEYKLEERPGHNTCLNTDG